MNKKLQELEKLAQQKIKEVLSTYVIDSFVRKELDVGYTFQEGVHSWLLYIPREPARDGVKLAEVQIDSLTLDTKVEVFENPYLIQK
jgi:hypothetical protein